MAVVGERLLGMLLRRGLEEEEREEGRNESDGWGAYTDVI